jgi:hypothetical protein
VAPSHMAAAVSPIVNGLLGSEPFGEWRNTTTGQSRQLLLTLGGNEVLGSTPERYLSMCIHAYPLKWHLRSVRFGCCFPGPAPAMITFVHP